MAYINERDFLLAFGNHTRQLWSERYLEFPMSPDEAWRLASHELFREKIERRLLDELGFRAIEGIARGCLASPIGWPSRPSDWIGTDTRSWQNWLNAEPR